MLRGPYRSQGEEAEEGCRQRHHAVYPGTRRAPLADEDDVPDLDILVRYPAGEYQAAVGYAITHAAAVDGERAVAEQAWRRGDGQGRRQGDQREDEAGVQQPPDDGPCRRQGDAGSPGVGG